MKRYFNKSYDSDAKIFFNAVINNGGMLSLIEKQAINTYVKTLKANSLWELLLADYPFVGSSAVAHAINLKTPGTFNLIFVNTVAGDHVANGWTPNGTTSYARMGIIPATHLTLNSVALEFYSRTNVAGSVEIGTITVSGSQMLQMRVLGNSSANPCLFDCYDASRW